MAENFLTPFGYTTSISIHPKICPLCHTSIKPILKLNYQKTTDKFTASQIFQCTNCDELFITKFKFDSQKSQFLISELQPNTPQKLEIDNRINTLSPNFSAIYQQAICAHAYNLNLVSGPALRKAFDCLIKDFCEAMHPENLEKIARMSTGNLIHEYIHFPRLQAFAEKTAWLGNDEAHPERKWTEYDVTDLKEMIDICMHHIIAELKCIERTDFMEKNKADRNKK